MSLESRVIALLEEANPVPDARALASDARPGSSDLVSLAEGRTDLDHVVVEPAPAPHRWLIGAAIAAFAVGLIVVLIQLTAPPDPIDSVTTTTVVETNSIEGYWEARTFGIRFESEGYSLVANDVVVDTGSYDVEGDLIRLTSSADSASCQLGDTAIIRFKLEDNSLTLDSVDDECPPGRGLGSAANSLSPSEVQAMPPNALAEARTFDTTGPGRHRTTVFQPAFELVLTPLWRQQQAEEAEVNLSLFKGTTALVFHRHTQDSPEGVYQLYEEHPNVTTTDPVPASVGEAEGLRFDYESDGPNGLISMPGIGLGPFIEPPGNLQRVWVVEVSGEIVTILSGHAPENRELSLAEVEAILATVTWDDLNE